MINITIDENGKSSPNTINIGNQWENRDEELVFSFPEEFKDFNKYVIAYIKNRKTKKEIRQIFPITNDTFIVSSGVTRYAGSWHLYTLCKENPLDLDSDTVDIRAKNGERISISDSINAIITPNDIGDDAFENFPIDENIKLIYDELFALKLEFEKADAVREENELARKHEEELRVQAENARVQAEANRVESEKSRVNAEGVRVQSETNRVSAEQSRVGVEKTRVNAENERVSSETLRKQTETNRIETENLRVSAENARVTSEQERVSAETLRKQAETKREGTISKLREDLDSNTKADGRTQRSLTALWDLNKGISYRFEEDNEKAYMKTVPSGAKLGAVNKIGGRTIVYNQLFTEKATIKSNGITATYADGVLTLNGTAKENCSNFSPMTSAMNVVAKIYIKMTILKNDDKLSFYYGFLNRDTGMQPISSGSTSAIYNQTEDQLKRYLNTGIADFGAGAVFNDVKLKIIIVNLTKMFGKGNEPTTTAEFEAMFPNDYYPYNEGTLISMSVNEVEEVGKNIFKCEHFSCIGIDGRYEPSLSNSYGTSINSTEPSNSVTVMQSKINQGSIATSYENGYFCVSFKPIVLNKDYIFSFDVIPSKKLIENPKVMISLNGNTVFRTESTQDLQVDKRIRLYFNLTSIDKNKKVIYIEIRNSGISGVFENFQIEECSVNTAYKPYHKNHYPIPQAIQNLDGYGWGVGNIYNYVDYENKKYYKRVGRYAFTGDETFINNETYIGTNSTSCYTSKDIGQKQLFSNKVISNKLSYLEYNWSVDSNYNTVCFNIGRQIHIRILNSVLGITSESSSDEIITAMNNYLKNLYDSGDPVVIYYELAEPIVTDISDIIEDTFQEPINVESGGSLAFKNSNGDDYQVAVPNEVRYVVSLKEVNP